MGRHTLFDYSLHFIFPENATGTYTVTCRHCLKELKVNSKTKYNLAVHLKLMHKAEHNNARTGNLLQSNQPTVTSPMIFTRMVNNKYRPEHPKQKFIDKAITDWVAADLRPLKTLQTKHFRRMVEELHPEYRVPSEDCVQRLILSRAQMLKASLKMIFTGIEEVCGTADLWSDKREQSYLAVTVHWISLKWELCSVMLACTRFRGCHTGENISRAFDEILHEYGLTAKIQTIVTDNATNFLKGFSLPGLKTCQPGEEPMEHGRSVKTEQTTDVIGDGAHDYDGGSNHEADSDDEAEFTAVNFTLERYHQPCYAHTLQLCVEDGLEHSGSAYASVLAKASSKVRSIKGSGHTSDILGVSLQTANATRWNSQLTMLRSVLVVDDATLFALGKAGLTTSDRESIKELINILTPFEVVTNLLQAENTVTASLIIPCTLQLMSDIARMCHSSGSRLLGALLDSVNRRLGKYLTIYENEKATFLDPRFKSTFLSAETEALILDEAKSSCVIPYLVSCDLEPPAKRPKFFTVVGESSSRSFAGNSNSKIVQEFSTYKSETLAAEDSCPLDFWKVNSTRFPALANLARRVLSCPASSGPVERLFSVPGNKFRAGRFRLSDETFENLMAIRASVLHN